MSVIDEELVRKTISDVLPEIDTDSFDYLYTIISDGNETIESEADFTESILPFIESYGLDNCETLCTKLYHNLKAIGLYSKGISDNNIRLLDKAVSLATINVDSEEIERFWGLNAVRSKRNDTMETNTSSQAKKVGSCICFSIISKI